ncbi:MAG TPA: type II toxin-antitoxin system HipA family toxin [Verrucomicrobiae bacterium]|nr:type II toxin-antitoxin system HipA family toxin [Verrucomicrobiae bacterium]
MTGPVYVWSDLWGKPELVAGASIDGRTGIFRYAPTFVAAQHPSIDPLNLSLADEDYRTGANAGVFGVLADAGPDGWGRRVLKSRHPKRMANASVLDVLVMSGGHGTGSLLFSLSRDAVKRRPDGISLADLGAAAEAAYQVEMGEVLRGPLHELMRAGSSLGGIHPKIAVTHEGAEWIAKFRGREDVVDSPRVEWAAMRLARECGIDAAEVRLTAVGERASVLVRRFDRHPIQHYASAHALWNRARMREDALQDWASYAGIVDLRRRLPGGDPRKDAEELFRRLVLNVVIGNTDDHGRNHGFLMDTAGAWRLSPAFDVLPNVGDTATVQALGAGPDGPERSPDNVIRGAAAFSLDRKRAGDIVEEISARVHEHFSRLLREAGVPEADRETVLGRVIKP